MMAMTTSSSISVKALIRMFAPGWRPAIFITVQFPNESLDRKARHAFIFMTKKQWILLAVALALAVLYVHYFTDWFKPKVMQISYTERPLASRSRNSLPMVLFGFEGQQYRLSEIKVVPLAAWQTNQSVAPVWHLIANSRSAPVEFFQYSQDLPGMKPAIPREQPEPLQSNVVYRLFVRAGSLKGQCDFQLGGRPPALSSKQ
ncbi:MAG: hypothetical protein WBN22_13935 [Verrucomicrobiia bacterium]